MMRLLHNRIAVKVQPDKRSHGGVLLPDSVVPRRGTVTHTAPSVRSVSVGDEVMFGRHALADHVTDNGEVLMMEADVLMVNGIAPTDRVLVAPITEERVGSIIVPVCGRTPPSRAKVVSVGPDVTEVIQSDVVHYNKHDGMTIEIDGVSYMMLRECDVLGVEGD